MINRSTPLRRLKAIAAEATRASSTNPPTPPSKALKLLRDTAVQREKKAKSRNLAKHETELPLARPKPAAFSPRSHDRHLPGAENPFSHFEWAHGLIHRHHLGVAVHTEEPLANAHRLFHVTDEWDTATAPNDRTTEPRQSCQ